MITQERGIADPQTTEKILAIGMAYDEGENNNDPAAIAALFTEDADLERGPSTSRDTVPER